MELLGVSGRPLIIIGIAYLVISKIFLMMSWYLLYHKLPSSIAQQDYTKIKYNMNTFKILAIYEVIVTFIYFMLGLAIINTLT